MLTSGAAQQGAVADFTTQHKVLRGVLQPGDKPPARALAQITSGRAGYHPWTGHALPDPMDQAPLAIHRDRALDLGHPHRPHTNRGRPRYAEEPPPKATAFPHLQVPRLPQDPPLPRP